MMWARSASQMSQTARHAPHSLKFPLISLTALFWLGSSVNAVSAHSDTRALCHGGAHVHFQY